MVTTYFEYEADLRGAEQGYQYMDVLFILTDPSSLPFLHRKLHSTPLVFLLPIPFGVHSFHLLHGLLLALRAD